MVGEWIRAFALVGVALFAMSCRHHTPVPREGFIQVPGGRVWYRVVGSGSAIPLLLLHGGPGFPSDYLAPLERLANERPVIFYDQLGAGRSDRPDNPALWQLDRFVAELANVRIHLGLKHVHLLGHSWGAALAIDYVLGRPDGIASLALISPLVSTPRWAADARRLREELPDAVRETLSRHEADGTTASEEYQAATLEFYKRYVIRLSPWPPEFERSFSAMGVPIYNAMWGPNEFFPTGRLRTYDRSDRLHEITVPTLFTAGRFDEATPQSVAMFQSRVRRSELLIFEHSAHMAMLEETDAFIAQLRAFLARAEHY